MTDLIRKLPPFVTAHRVDMRSYFLLHRIDATPAVLHAIRTSLEIPTLTLVELIVIFGILCESI